MNALWLHSFKTQLYISSFWTHRASYCFPPIDIAWKENDPLNACAFLHFLANWRCPNVRKILNFYKNLSPNCSKFGVECDWKRKISQKRMQHFLKAANLLQNAYQCLLFLKVFFPPLNWRFAKNQKKIEIRKAKKISRSFPQKITLSSSQKANLFQYR